MMSTSGNVPHVHRQIEDRVTDDASNREACASKIINYKVPRMFTITRPSSPQDILKYHRQC